MEEFSLSAKCLTPTWIVEATSTSASGAKAVHIPPKLPMLSSVEAEKFLLSLPEVYQNPALILRRRPDYGLLSAWIGPTSIWKVQGSIDPYANMWPGPVDFDGHIWPTHEHAIINVKLGATSEMPVSKIYDNLIEYADTNPFWAKKFGQIKS